MEMMLEGVMDMEDDKVADTVMKFIATQDPLEVVFVSLPVTLRTNLTDVTLVSEDTC